MVSNTRKVCATLALSLYFLGNAHGMEAQNQEWVPHVLSVTEGPDFLKGAYCKLNIKDSYEIQAQFNRKVFSTQISDARYIFEKTTEDGGKNIILYTMGQSRGTWEVFSTLLGSDTDIPFTILYYRSMDPVVFTSESTFRNMFDKVEWSFKLNSRFVQRLSLAKDCWHFKSIKLSLDLENVRPRSGSVPDYTCNDANTAYLEAKGWGGRSESDDTFEEKRQRTKCKPHPKTEAEIKRKLAPRKVGKPGHRTPQEAGKHVDTMLSRKNGVPVWSRGVKWTKISSAEELYKKFGIEDNRHEVLFLEPKKSKKPSRDSSDDEVKCGCWGFFSRKSNN